MQNLHSENYNVLLKEIKVLNKWKTFHGDRFEDLMWFLIKDLEARTIIPIGLEIFSFAKTYFVCSRCSNTLITIFNSL